MEHSYNLALGPFSGFTITPMVSWINYESFFSATTSAAFKFEPDIIDRDERALIIGADGQYALNSKLIVAADYKNFGYDIAGSANYYGGGLTYKVFETSSVGLGYHRMDGDNERLKYNEYRAYVHDRAGKFDVILDGLYVKYDEDINGRDYCQFGLGCGWLRFFKRTEDRGRRSILQKSLLRRGYQGLL